MKSRYYFLIFILIPFLLTGCYTDLSPEVNDEKDLPSEVNDEKEFSSEENGVYINGNMATALKSAFVGGAISDPDVGSSHRFHIYEEMFNVGPRWNEVKEKVFVSGFEYRGKDYSDFGDCIDLVNIMDIPSIGDLSIPLNQGKYEGGHELVASVSINKYSFGSYDNNGNQNEKSQINIHIVLTNKETIDILYTGSTPYDGYI